MRLHIAIVAPSGAAYNAYVSSVAEARRTAEGQLRARVEEP